MRPMTPETANDPRAEAILDFWFRGDVERKEWFTKDPSFDDEIRTRFLSLHAWIRRESTPVICHRHGSPHPCRSRPSD